MRRFIFVLLILIFQCSSLWAGSLATRIDFSSGPIAGASQSEPPLIMLVMGKDHKMFYRAYNNLTDVDGNGKIDLGFNPVHLYFGYFDSSLCYTFLTDGSGGAQNNPAGVNVYDGDTFNDVEKKNFFVIAGASNRTIGYAGGTCELNGKKYWSGNFLNYAVTSRIDALRKVLYGGKRIVDTNNLPTIIESSYLPWDSHSWGVEVPADDIWPDVLPKFDISLISPFDKPKDGTHHFFVRTSVKAPAKDLQNPKWLLFDGVDIKYRKQLSNINDLVSQGWTHTGSYYGTNRSASNPASSFQGAMLADTTTPVLVSLLNVEPVAPDVYNTADAALSLWPIDLIVGASWRPAPRQPDRIWDVVSTGGPIPQMHLYLPNPNDLKFISKDSSVVENAGKIGYQDFPAYSKSATQSIPGTFLPLRIEVCGGVYGDETFSGYPKASELNSIDSSHPLNSKPFFGQTSIECKQYTGSAQVPNIQKPIGILQKYGEDNRAFFGLISGSFAKNLSGGVLRSNIRPISEEVSPTSGVFYHKNAYSEVKGQESDLLKDFQGSRFYAYTGEAIPGDLTDAHLKPGGIIRTIDSFHIRGWTGTTYGGPEGGCDGNNKAPLLINAVGAFKLVDVNGAENVGYTKDSYNECESWGNPLSEMMYEAVRYFTKDATPSNAYSYNKSSSSVSEQRYNLTDAFLDLPLEKEWISPFTNASIPGAVCGRPSIIVIGDIYNSYDMDDLPGLNSASQDPFSALADVFPWVANESLLKGESVKLPSLKNIHVNNPSLNASFGVDSYLDLIDSVENFSGKIFASRTALSGEGKESFDCSPKPFTSLKYVRGLCPNEPTQFGGYGMAAVTYYAHTHNMSEGIAGTNADNKIDFYFIAMSEPLPQLNFSDIGGNTINILPTGQTFEKANYMYSENLSDIKANDAIQKGDLEDKFKIPHKQSTTDPITCYTYLSTLRADNIKAYDVENSLYHKVIDGNYNNIPSDIAEPHYHNLIPRNKVDVDKIDPSSVTKYPVRSALPKDHTKRVNYVPQSGLISFYIATGKTLTSNTITVDQIALVQNRHYKNVDSPVVFAANGNLARATIFATFADFEIGGKMDVSSFVRYNITLARKYVQGEPVDGTKLIPIYGKDGTDRNNAFYYLPIETQGDIAGATNLLIEVEMLHTSSEYVQHFGYIISGTKGYDGVYYEVTTHVAPWDICSPNTTPHNCKNPLSSLDPSQLTEKQKNQLVGDCLGQYKDEGGSYYSGIQSQTVGHTLDVCDFSKTCSDYTIRYATDTANGNFVPGYGECGNYLPVKHARLFQFASGDVQVKQLPSPMLLAAKYGGFKDKNNNGKPDLKAEWDTNNDGLPENFYYITNADRLSLALEGTIRAILGNIKAGTSTSSVISSMRGGGIALHTFYYPSVEDARGRKVEWVGRMYALFVDQWGNYRENSFDSFTDKVRHTKSLNIVADASGGIITGDLVVKFITDEKGLVKVQRYTDTLGNNTLLPYGKPVALDKLNPVWDMVDVALLDVNATNNPRMKFNVFTYNPYRYSGLNNYLSGDFEEGKKIVTLQKDYNKNFEDVSQPYKYWGDWRLSGGKGIPLNGLPLSSGYLTHTKFSMEGSWSSGETDYESKGNVYYDFMRILGLQAFDLNYITYRGYADDGTQERMHFYFEGPNGYNDAYLLQDGVEFPRAFESITFIIGGYPGTIQVDYENDFKNLFIHINNDITRAELVALINSKQIRGTYPGVYLRLKLPEGEQGDEPFVSPSVVANNPAGTHVIVVYNKDEYGNPYFSLERFMDYIVGRNDGNKHGNSPDGFFRNKHYEVSLDPDPNGYEKHIPMWSVGDIINSKPVIVGVPNSGYDVNYGDQSYAMFKRLQLIRGETAYVGTNDGMLRAIHMGYKDDYKEYKVAYSIHNRPRTGLPKDAGLNLGLQVWAYIPTSLLPHLKWLPRHGYGSEHVFYVDLTPTIVDLAIYKEDGIKLYNYGNWGTDEDIVWQTYLIGALRLGAKGYNISKQGAISSDMFTEDAVLIDSEVFALNVTNEAAMGAPALMWRYTGVETAYAEDPSEATLKANVDRHMGLVMGRPALMRINTDEAGNPGGGKVAKKQYIVVPAGPSNLDYYFSRDQTESDFVSNNSKTQYKGNSDQPLRVIVLEAVTGEYITTKKPVETVRGEFDNAHFAEATVVKAKRGVKDVTEPKRMQWTNEVAYIGYAGEKYFGNFKRYPGGVMRLITISEATGKAVYPKDWTLAPLIRTDQPVSGAVNVVTDCSNVPWVFFGTGRGMWSAADSDPCSGECNKVGDDCTSCKKDTRNYFYGVRENVSFKTFPGGSVKRVVDYWESFDKINLTDVTNVAVKTSGGNITVDDPDGIVTNNNYYQAKNEVLRKNIANNGYRFALEERTEMMTHQPILIPINRCDPLLVVDSFTPLSGTDLGSNSTTSCDVKSGISSLYLFNAFTGLASPEICVGNSSLPFCLSSGVSRKYEYGKGMSTQVSVLKTENGYRVYGSDDDGLISDFLIPGGLSGSVRSWRMVFDRSYGGEYDF